jgi:hypothetical protein
MAQIRFNRIRADYLKQAPEVFDLLRRLHAAECEVAGLCAVLDLVATAGGLDHMWRARIPKAEPSASSKELLARWRAALAAIENNPEAPLPT